MKSPKIVFFGNEMLAQGIVSPITPAFEGLLENGYTICALVLPSRTDSARSRNKRVFRVVELAQKEDIPIIYTDQETDLNSTLRNLKADVGVLSSFGRIVSQETIDIFPSGILNIHPSLLPKYRGTTPIESAILNGDSETGVSVMALVAKMDAGPVYAQRKIALSGNETKDNVYEKLALLGAEMLLEIIPNMTNITPTAQNDSKASFTQKLDKSMSKLDAKNKSARELYNQIRAFTGFPKSKLQINNLECVVTEAEVSDAKNTTLDQQCCDGKFLVIKKLVPPGKKEITALDFINGYLR